jgi:hypothetical protein
MDEEATAWKGSLDAKMKVDPPPAFGKEQLKDEAFHESVVTAYNR